MRYLNIFKRIVKLVILEPIRIKKGLKIIFTKGPYFFVEKLRSLLQQSDNFALVNKQYRSWLKQYYPRKEALEKQRKISKSFNYQPLISIILPTYNTPIKFLKECIDSVLNQSYENWELCIADDASTIAGVRDTIERFAKRDKRIKYSFREVNGHICEASNSAASLANGEFVALLDHDDFLWPNALFEVVSKLNEDRKIEFIYSDEDKLSEGGKHIDPFFKPDWSPHYLRSVNYITHFSVLKKSLFEKVGRFRVGFEGAQDWDLFLRASQILKPEQIAHIPTILYSWRKSENSTSSEKAAGKVKLYAYENQKKALLDDLLSRGYKGKVVESGNLGSWRVRYDIIGNPKISIIIPTKDKFSYISRCLDSVLNKTTYKNIEIIAVDTGSREQKVLDLYEKMQKNYNNFKLYKWEKEFNFASVCNLGVERSSGEYILLLNNDTEVITPDWIEGLLEYAQLPEVGAVGCKLLYPDKTIQHAGIVLGITGGYREKGIAGHAFRFLRDNVDIRAMLHGVKDYSAVTAACLMVNKRKYLEVGGQDSIFKIAFNDVDFNLKLLEKGYYNVYNGFVKLVHYESVSVEKPGSKNRDLTQFEREINIMHERWDEILQNDPFYNKNLSLDFEDFRLRVK